MERSINAYKLDFHSFYIALILPQPEEQYKLEFSMYTRPIIPIACVDIELILSKLFGIIGWASLDQNKW